MNDLMFFVVAALATNQAVEIWQHSPLFAESRQRQIDMAMDFRPELEVWNYHAMLSCPWCLSVWVGAIVGALLATDSAAGWPCYALAISRAANLTNDLTYKWLRTPKEERGEFIADDELDAT